MNVKKVILSIILCWMALAGFCQQNYPLLGVSSACVWVLKFGNMLDKDLVIIGKFHGEHGLQMSQSAKTEVKELERTTKRLVDNFDEKLMRLIKNASQSSLGVTDAKQSISNLFINFIYYYSYD